MDRQLAIMIGIATGLIILDFYILSGLRGTPKKWKFLRKAWFVTGYWALSIFLLTALFVCIFCQLSIGVKGAILMVFFLIWVAKLLFSIFVLVDDVRRLFLWKARESKNETAEAPAKADTQPNAIPRSEFIMKTGLLAGTLPVATLALGTISGVYDYRVRHQTLYLPNLPKAFDGIKLGQVSDIHSGSFYNKKAVLGGIDMLLAEKPDFIFFTGDLVNHKTDEMYNYQDIFSKVKAPLGVYSSLGNHDYGDYHDWPTPQAKKQNLADMKATHKNMGWDLLLNSNRRLKVDGEEIGILGVENWGSISRFPRYGRIDDALKNTDDLPVKLLLSHDPSHWRAQILNHLDVDVMFSGHTHGMQLGIRTQNFQWSPIQYVYKEWAGLYREGNQQLYVNTGYGFLGYPGRVGILPEITIFTLKAASDLSLKSKTA